MKVLHITSGLGNGGAEGMLYRICKVQKTYPNLETNIINLSTNDWYEKKLLSLGIKVHKINLKKNFFDIFRLINLIKLIIQLKPDVIQTWMYHANLLGGILGYFFSNAKIFWNVRHTRVSIKYSKILTIIIVHISAFFSYFIPKKIIYCSVKSKKVHEDKFYHKKKSVYIPNGYDNTFFPSNSIRKKFRKKNYISTNYFVVGLAARFHKEKNFINLIEAFKLFSFDKKKVFLFLKGINVSKNNKYFSNAFSKINNKNYTLENNSSNILDFMNGIDLFVLPSLSESFPNVLAEAMLCETPCVSTNVGQSKEIFKGTNNLIVPVNNSFKLFKAIDKSYQLFKQKKKWQVLKKKSRLNIIKKYDIKNISIMYFKLWKKN